MKQQFDELATPAPKITKEIMQIDWNKSAQEIQNLIRAFSPWPGAFFIHDGKLIKVYRTKIANKMNLSAGKILEQKEKLFIGCGDDAVEILEIQLEGHKKLSVTEFLRGYSFSNH